MIFPFSELICPTGDEGLVPHCAVDGCDGVIRPGAVNEPFLLGIVGYVQN